MAILKNISGQSSYLSIIKILLSISTKQNDWIIFISVTTNENLISPHDAVPTQRFIKRTAYRFL